MTIAYTEPFEKFDYMNDYLRSFPIDMVLTYFQSLKALHSCIFTVPNHYFFLHVIPLFNFLLSGFYFDHCCVGSQRSCSSIEKHSIVTRSDYENRDKIRLLNREWPVISLVVNGQNNES